jgi:hypothetical protein
MISKEQLIIDNLKHLTDEIHEMRANQQTMAIVLSRVEQAVNEQRGHCGFMHKEVDRRMDSFKDELKIKESRRFEDKIWYNRFVATSLVTCLVSVVVLFLKGCV